MSAIDVGRRRNRVDYRGWWRTPHHKLRYCVKKLKVELPEMGSGIVLALAAGRATAGLPCAACRGTLLYRNFTTATERWGSWPLSVNFYAVVRHPLVAPVVNGSDRSKQWQRWNREPAEISTEVAL